MLWTKTKQGLDMIRLDEIENFDGRVAKVIGGMIYLFI
jgi:hypothetical protein